MKVLPHLFIFILLTSFWAAGCVHIEKFDVETLSKDWETIYEIKSEFSGDNLIRSDTSSCCWLFDRAKFCRIFRDSTYIVYDTTDINGNEFLIPKHKGSFRLVNDSLILDNLKTTVLKLTDDTLIIERKVESTMVR